MNYSYHEEHDDEPMSGGEMALVALISIIVIAVVVFVTYQRYKLAATAMRSGHEGLAAAALAPEIGSGIGAIFGN